MRPSLAQRILAFLLAAQISLPGRAAALRPEPPAEAHPSTLTGLEEGLNPAGPAAQRETDPVDVPLLGRKLRVTRGLPPPDDSFAFQFILFIQHNPERFRGKRVLEIGCGVGPLTIALARVGAFVTAIDIVPEAVEATRENLKAEPPEVQARVVALGESDVYDALPSILGEEPPPFDVIVSAHPLVKRRQDRQSASSLAGHAGSDFEMPRKILAGLPVYLKTGGSYYSIAWKETSLAGGVWSAGWIRSLLPSGYGVVAMEDRVFSIFEVTSPSGLEEKGAAKRLNRFLALDPAWGVYAVPFALNAEIVDKALGNPDSALALGVMIREPSPGGAISESQAREVLARIQNTGSDPLGKAVRADPFFGRTLDLLAPLSAREFAGWIDRTYRQAGNIILSIPPLRDADELEGHREEMERVFRHEVGERGLMAELPFSDLLVLAYEAIREDKALREAAQQLLPEEVYQGSPREFWARLVEPVEKTPSREQINVFIASLRASGDSRISQAVERYDRIFAFTQAESQRIWPKVWKALQSRVRGEWRDAGLEEDRSPEWHPAIRKILERHRKFLPIRFSEEGYVYHVLGSGLREGLSRGRFSGRDPESAVFYVSEDFARDITPIIGTYMSLTPSTPQRDFGRDAALLVIPAHRFNEAQRTGQAAVAYDGRGKWPLFAGFIPLEWVEHIVVRPDTMAELEAAGPRPAGAPQIHSYPADSLKRWKESLGIQDAKEIRDAALPYPGKESTPQVQIHQPDSPAGLEEGLPQDAELFANERPEQIPNIPEGTGRILTVPLQATVTLYSPDTLAAGLEELISRERQDLKGLAVERKPVPSSADQVQRPSVFVWDTLLVLSYDPRVPVVRHQLGRPFPYRLLQLVVLAHLGSEAAGYRILAAWTYNREGQEVLAIALSA